MLLFGGCLHGSNMLEIQEAEFIFPDKCFATAVSYSAHCVWESAWESDTVNNLPFKAVAIPELISKLPHGNLKSTEDGLCNQS